MTSVPICLSVPVPTANVGTAPATRVRHSRHCQAEASPTDHALDTAGPELCLVFSLRDGGGGGIGWGGVRAKKKFVHLKWASLIFGSRFKISFSSGRKSFGFWVGGGGLACGVGPPYHPPPPPSRDKHIPELVPTELWMS